MVNDLLLTMDYGGNFDTVDHRILLDRLKSYIGVVGQVLQWLKSYLSERSQCIFFNNKLSTSCVVKYGVPQGSVFGPLLFSYLAPLGQIPCSGIAFHCYASDLHHMAVAFEDQSDITKLEACFAAVRIWL